MSLTEALNPKPVIHPPNFALSSLLSGCLNSNAQPRLQEWLLVETSGDAGPNLSPVFAVLGRGRSHCSHSIIKPFKDRQ